jgi:hypothetical protein
MTAHLSSPRTPRSRISRTSLIGDPLKLSSPRIVVGDPGVKNMDSQQRHLGMTKKGDRRGFPTPHGYNDEWKPKGFRSQLQIPFNIPPVSYNDNCPLFFSSRTSCKNPSSPDPTPLFMPGNDSDLSRNFFKSLSLFDIKSNISSLSSIPLTTSRPISRYHIIN